MIYNFREHCEHMTEKDYEIYEASAWCPADQGDGTQVGWAYNRYMDLVGENDWVCFYDSDAMPMTKYPYRLLEAAVKEKPDAGAFVPMTGSLVWTRSQWQMLKELRGCHDLKRWQEVGLERFVKYGIQMQDVTDIDKSKGSGRQRLVPFSGVAFCVSKKTWVEMGGAPEGGFYGVDHQIHKRIRKTGKRIYLVLGWTVMHWGMDFRSTHLCKRPASMGGKPF